MFKSASVYFCKERPTELPPKCSTGILLLPESEASSDPFDYCKAYISEKYPKINGPHLLTFARIDRISKALETIDEKNYCIIVLDNPIDEASKELLKGKVEHPLVTPSVNLLDNRICKPSLEKSWLYLKFEGQTSRYSTERDLPSLLNTDEGIIQWGHLINEIAFSLGITTKYGD